MLLALRQVGRVENRLTHTNPGRHEKSDMRDSDILNYLYSKNKKKRKGDGFPTEPSIFYQRRVPCDLSDLPLAQLSGRLK